MPTPIMRKGSYTTVPAFRTTDGATYSTERDANDAQTAIDFRDWYESFDHPERVLYVDGLGLRVPHDELRKWLRDNKGVVMELYGES